MSCPFGVQTIKSRIRPLALHPMLALHPPPVKGRYRLRKECFKWSILEVCCPGPGISQGDLAVPPASKDAESPSHPFLLSSTEFHRPGMCDTIY